MLVSNIQLNLNKNSLVSGKKSSDMSFNGGVQNQTSEPQQKEVKQFAYVPVSTPVADSYNKRMNMIKSFLKVSLNENVDKTTVQKTSAVDEKASAPVVWKNDLRTMFLNNKVKINAIIIRTFNAKDKNGNQLIDKGEEAGTFKNAVERLDEIKGYGVNTLHLLPVNPPGKIGAFGTAGSVYAPKDFLEVDPVIGNKKDFKHFVDEAHKRNIRVMLDLPSCVSLDLYQARPDLMAIDAQGNAETPQGWQDIRMFDPFEDKDKRTLNKALIEYHKKFVDMCLEAGVDGIRADVARAKPVEFWDEIIPYARAKDPEFAFLAETYTYEDASPMLNMPHDRPEELLASGFDSFYGQYHIFPSMNTANVFHNYVKEVLEMSYRLPKGKSLIGSFATHDDKSPMSHGGVPYCNMTSAIQYTLPMTNPYFISGFESGDRYIYPYKDKIVDKSQSTTDCNQCIVHPEMLDIFNLSRKPGGNHPEVGQFLTAMSKIRENYEDVITKGSYIPLETGNKNDKVIAYARHLNGKTLVVVANKDVNMKETASIKIPGLQKGQWLQDLTPSYGVQSRYSANDGLLNMELGPARAHIFEINTPNIEQYSKHVWKQNI